MRGVAGLLFMAVMTSSMLSSSSGQKCPPTSYGPVYLPHPHDCSKFWRCQAGQPILAGCPLGQHFNPRSQTCDSPAQAGCTASSGKCSELPPGSMCPYQCTCLKDKVGAVCPATLKFAAEFNVIDVAANPACQREPDTFELGVDKVGQLRVRNAKATVSMCGTSTVTRVAHFGDCSRGVSCRNGQDEVLTCSQGLHFDYSTGFCDSPEYVKCTTSGLPASTSCPPGAALSSCPHSCTCDVQRGVCPMQLKFSADFSFFDNQKQPACLKGSAIIDLGDPFFGTAEIHPSSSNMNYCPASTPTAVLPYPPDCGKLVKCSSGVQRIISCPANLYFNPKTKMCDSPDPTICKAVTTGPTPTAVNGTACTPAVACPPWSSSRVRHITDCNLFCQCKPGTTPTLGTCAPGLHFNARTQLCDSPYNARCNTGTASTANQSADAAMLFIIDESGTIRLSDFRKEKKFVADMVKAFPLSQSRPAGVITFSSTAANVDISLRETSTCNFLSHLGRISYFGGGTDIANALNVATREVTIHTPNKKTLIFLLSDGNSQTDPLAAAQNLRSSQHILFTIGVARFERSHLELISSTYTDGAKLFFPLSSPQVFSVVAEYMKTQYNPDATVNCP